MITIEIDDQVWSMFKKSWALMGVKDHEVLVRMLENDILRPSVSVIKYGEEELLGETPEAYALRDWHRKDDGKKNEQITSGIDLSIQASPLFRLLK